MRKTTHINTMKYTYDGTRQSRAKWYIDHIEKWLNHGDYAEILCKHCLGYDPVKDVNTAYDKGHDIPELAASVKSWQCGLTTKKDMPREKMEFLEVFMANDPSEQFIFVADVADEVNLYYLDRKEMRDFILSLWTWDSHCNNWRVTKSTTKIFTYLEARVGAQTPTFQKKGAKEMKRLYKITTVYGTYYKASHADLRDYARAAWFCDVPQAAVIKVEFVKFKEYFLEKGIDKQFKIQ